MNKRPWHRRFHKDALEGMADLPLDLRGAYDTLMNLIYKRGGSLVDDDHELLPAMGPGCSMQRWRRIKAELIARGKITIFEGQLSNPRAEKELGAQFRYFAERTESGRSGGVKSGEARRKKSKKISDIIPGKYAGTSAEHPKSPEKSPDVSGADASKINTVPEADLQDCGEAKTKLTANLLIKKESIPLASSPAPGRSLAAECGDRPTGGRKIGSAQKPMRTIEEQMADLAAHAEAERGGIAA